jgi:mitosis inhibitor protein kinase SWE1
MGKVVKLYFCDRVGLSTVIVQRLRRTFGTRLSSLFDMANKGKGKDDGVVEATSPGGHVMKRQARSRPVSQELLESVNYPPSPSPTQVIVYM